MPTVHALADLATSPTAFRFEGGPDGADISFFVTRTLPGRGSSLHTHPYSEVFVLLEGEATYTVGDERLSLAAGHVAVVPPDTPHRYENTGDVPLLQVSVHDGGTMVQDEVG